MNMAPGAVALICCSMLAAIPLEPSTTLFENEQVKVIRALEKAHVKGKFHEHKLNRVMIYLQPGKQRFEFQDGRAAKTSEFRAGEVAWSEPEGMHSPEVVSDAGFNIIEIELKTAGTGKTIASELDPAKIDPKHYQVDLENSEVRVLRAKVEGHGVTPLHTHSLNRVTVFLTDQDFRVKDDHGNVSLVKHKAGEAIWGTPVTHSEENLSDQPFEVLAVELK